MNKYGNIISLNIQRFGWSSAPTLDYTEYVSSANDNYTIVYPVVHFKPNSTTYNQSAYVQLTINGTTQSKITVNVKAGTQYDISLGSFRFDHASDGSLSNIAMSCYVYVVSNTTGTASSTYVPTRIARYFSSISLSYKSKTETSITYNWNTGETCDSMSGSGGGTVSSITGVPGKSGTITFTNLSVNSAYTHKISARRQDSGLISSATASSVSTYNYPYITGINDFAMGQSTSLTLYNPLSRNVSLSLKLGDNVLDTTSTTGTSATFANINVEPIYNQATYDSKNITLTAYATYSSSVKSKNVIVSTILPMITTNEWNRPTPTSDIVKNTNVVGSFYNGTIGSTQNTITAQYCYKASDSTEYTSWVDITGIEAEEGSNSFKITEDIQIPISYTKTGTVKIKISDISKTYEFEGKITKGQPVFYVSENTFGVNGQLLVNGQPAGGDSLPIGTIVDYDGTTVPSGYELYNEVLWTNSNPNAKFSAQNITLSSNNYEILEIYFKFYYSVNQVISVRALKGYDSFMCCYSGYEKKGATRNIGYVNDTTLKIDNAFYDSTTSSQEYCIPIKIIGYK